jgi:hypothetical protein
VPVGHLDPVRRRRPQQRGDGRGVGGVRHEQQLVRADEVDDQVVDDAAAVVQHSVYWAWPGRSGPRSAVRQRLTNAAAPGR